MLAGRTQMAKRALRPLLLGPGCWPHHELTGQTAMLLPARQFSGSLAMAIQSKNLRSSRPARRQTPAHASRLTREPAAKREDPTAGRVSLSDPVTSTSNETPRNDGPRLLFIVSLPFILFLIPAALSGQRDQELEAAAKGQGGLVKSLLDRFRFPALSGADTANDRAILTSVLRHEQAARLGKLYRGVRDSIQSWPRDVQDVVNRHFLWGCDWYVTLRPSQQATIPIISINTAVFLAWSIATPLASRRGGLLKFMSENFVHRLLDRRYYTVITSAFSHQSLMHFGFNQYAMWTVGSLGIIAALNAREAHAAEIAAERGSQVSPRRVPLEVDFRYQTFAAFLFCAVGGTAVSSLWRRTIYRLWTRRLLTIARNPQLSGKPINRRPWEQMNAGGLGSSGGVYGLFALTALAVEEPMRLGIVFLPSDFSMPLQTGFGLMCCVDLVLLLSGRWVFDHAAHLGGAACGALWWWVGQDIWILVRNALAPRTDAKEVIAQAS
ncbi:unnamed protein product [Parajaminaea phylloscopi]